MRGLERFDGRAQFTTWAHRVTTNCCLDELRRRRRRPDSVVVDDTVDARAFPGRAVSDSGAVAEQIDLDSALRSLSHDFRVAVVLRDQCGMAYEEIAEVVGVPVGTVRSRISRGRSLLAEGLGKGYRSGESSVGQSAEPEREPATVSPTSKGLHEQAPTMSSTMTDQPTISGDPEDRS